MDDRRWMEMAIAEGLKGRLDAPPNPWVGCILVKNGQIFGLGHHPECGLPHAEVYALREAGQNARGATAYVTLEPCVHTGRTLPCVHALIEAGVARVVVGVEDPDPKVSGSGIAALKIAGIKVTVGVEREAVELSLAPYLHHRRTGRPFVIAKTALSIDGRAAASDKTSQWISCEAARRDAHEMRAESQAILIGAGTAVKDSPQLTVRQVNKLPKKQPLRVLLDPNGKVPHDSPLYDLDLAPTLVFSEKMEPEKILSILGEKGVIQLLIEGGPTTITQFLQQHLIDRLIVYTGPCLLGSDGLPGFGSMGICSMENALKLRLLESSAIGNSVKSVYAHTSQ